MFVPHLDLRFRQLNLLVINLQNFKYLGTSITFNEYTVLLLLLEKLRIRKLHNCTLHIKLLMGSLNVDSLFTNIPLKDTINLCTNLLYNNVSVIEGINKSEMRTFYPWLPRNRTLCLAIFFINKRTAWP